MKEVPNESSFDGVDGASEWGKDVTFHESDIHDIRITPKFN